jgi:hypothetical protein
MIGSWFFCSGIGRPGALLIDVSDLFYLWKLDEARGLVVSSRRTDAEDDIPLIEATLRMASRLPEPPLQATSDRPQ